MRALALVAIVCACNKQAGELQLVEIKKADLVIGVVVSGALEAVDSTDIKPPAVEIWNFKISMLAPEGAEVKEGQPIVGFDASEQTRELETMENEVEAARKKLDKKRDDAARARREEDLALANAEAAVRKAALKADTPKDVIATVDLKVHELDRRAAELALDLQKSKMAAARRSDEAELEKLKSKLDYAVLRVQKLQQYIEKMVVKSPRAGTVVYPTRWGDEKKKVGDGAWRMEVVLEVVALDKMIGKGEVDEIEMARVVPGQPVSLRLDALPDAQLRGKVESIARSVRPKSNADPSKVVEIKIALEATKSPLRPNMRFRGEVEVERVPDVVQIPTDAVFVTPEGPVAFREVGGRVEEVKLELGKRSTTMIEVKSGLTSGDRVTRVDPRGAAR